MWTVPSIPPPDAIAADAARKRWDTLTKPPGSLGRLESLVIALAAAQGRPMPRAEHIRALLFAGDHGVTVHQISPYPSVVTAQMVANFRTGGACANVLARAHNVQLEIIDVGVAHPIPGDDSGKTSNNPKSTPFFERRIANGTQDFLQGPAMDGERCARALAVGAERVAAAPCDLLVLGEMGIGNTTSAACLVAACTGGSPEAVTGRGTGIDDAGLLRKREAVRHALLLHADRLADPLSCLAALGGFEIAALVGALLAAAERRMPVLIDGFIVGAAALIALRLAPSSAHYFIWCHHSGEAGHARVLAAAGAEPLLDLGLRLGEGSGALCAVPIVRSACAIFSEMATFADAALSDKSDKSDKSDQP